MAQNANGLAKTVKTTQDHLSLPEKSSGDYFACKSALTTEAENLAATVFMMDAALSFVSLAHNHQFIDDTGPASSLDFAFRVFSNRVNMNEWHFREMKRHHRRRGEDLRRI